jgi:glycosyltransferase involved in cell wall biosynthesis
LSSEQSDRSSEGSLHSPRNLKCNESDKPLISVITVVFNGKNYIEQAIRSVIGQTYDNVEYIIIDGGSTDGTLDIIKQYQEAIDYWVSETDHGVYDAMNKGVKLSNGDYILFLGCDDYLFDIFHEIVNFFQEKTVSYYGDVILSKNKKEYGGRFYSLKLFIKNIPHQAIFYSRHVFADFKFDCKYITVADYALNLKIFSNKKYGMKYISKTIAFYNNEHGISSTLIDHAFSLDKPEIIHNYYSMFHYLAYMSLRLIYKIKR